MPAAWIISVIGLAVMAAVLLHYGVSDQLFIEWLGAGGLLALAPMLLGVIRLVRGHYSDALDEP